MKLYYSIISIILILDFLLVFIYIYIYIYLHIITVLSGSTELLQQSCSVQKNKHT